jgi:cholesterol transport system auxiliary component
VKLIRGIGAFCLFLALTACQVLPEPQSVTLYQLPETETAGIAGEPVSWSLRISTPRTTDALSGNRLMVMTNNHALTAFAGVRWESSVPELWRDHLHRSLLADGRIPSVSTARENLKATRELLGTLRDFQAELGGSPRAVVIRYDAVIADINSRRQLARRTFFVREPVDNDSAPALVEGFGRASQKLSADVVNWLLTVDSK